MTMVEHYEEVPTDTDIVLDHLTQASERLDEIVAGMTATLDEGEESASEERE
jgi:hypothetical protein